ncbi:MAG: hypothetical protein ACRD9R_13635 [Pyrinomonadaceae bacterium]
MSAEPPAAALQAGAPNSRVQPTPAVAAATPDAMLPRARTGGAGRTIISPPTEILLTAKADAALFNPQLTLKEDGRF